MRQTLWLQEQAVQAHVTHGVEVAPPAVAVWEQIAGRSLEGSPLAVKDHLAVEESGRDELKAQVVAVLAAEQMLSVAVVEMVLLALMVTTCLTFGRETALVVVEEDPLPSVTELEENSCLLLMISALQASSKVRYQAYHPDWSRMRPGPAGVRHPSVVWERMVL